ncbi:hypothetical protein FE697_019490 [Mumia zhuanghuii]|uniref:Uncharacterized protein n=2 Tax=Mumia TaxID=1546255 RepID=A0ABW1QR32_9ACTN|nr:MULTISPECIES: hypothetical protein [Mumia]KAA1420064.1 hypothetical protein FE697_019490 [Mumia zhuanghuii]
MTGPGTFVMVGEDAPTCVDGVCTVPGADAGPSLPAAPAPAQTGPVQADPASVLPAAPHLHDA